MSDQSDLERAKRTLAAVEDARERLDLEKAKRRKFPCKADKHRSVGSGST